MKRLILIALAALAVLSLTPISFAAGPLTQAEADGLAYMREEEKLAHDVYMALGEKWDLPIFDNISRAETQHGAATLSLLEQYGLSDPAAGRPAGEFGDATLQQLYDSLTARGLQSLEDALRVGAEIEEIDILDLQANIEKTDQTTIRAVYENLLRGSENHLQAFSRTLERQSGEEYRPQHVSQEAYGAQGGRGMGRSGGRGR